MKQLLYIVAIVLFCSCKTGEFIEKELITFETGFPIQHNAYGIYYDSKTEQEYIYFGAYMDSAYVRFFTLDGKRTNKMPDIPLYQVTKNLVKVSTILVYDLDTVICIDKYEYNNKTVTFTGYFYVSQDTEWKKFENNEPIVFDSIDKNHVEKYGLKFVSSYDEIGKTILILESEVQRIYIEYTKPYIISDLTSGYTVAFEKIEN